MMRAYEVMFVIDPQLDADTINAVIEKYKGLIVNNGGEVTNVDIWGKRRLAYEIKDLREGYYVVAYFNGDAPLVAELDRVLKIDDAIMRYIIVKKEK